MVRTVTMLAGLMLLGASLSVAQMQSIPKESEQLEFATQLLGASEFQSAANSYESFIRQYPHSSLLPNAYVGAGDSHFFLKEPEKAMEFYQLYDNQFPNGKDKWLVTLREAQCLSLKGKQGEALAKLTSLDPSSIKPEYQQIYYFYLAKAYMDKGDLKQAADYFEKVVQIKSGNEYATLAYLQLSAILARTGHNKDAVEVYNGALQSNDSNDMQAKIRYMQAVAYMQAQKYDLAAAAFQNVVEDYPTSAMAKDAAVNWFSALLRNNQPEAVIAEYNQRYKDNYDDASLGPLHLMASAALLQSNNDDQARSILDALIGSSSMTQEVKAKAVFQKAKMLADSGQFDDALGLLNTQASGDKDTQASIELLKGQIYFGQNDYAKADEAFGNAGQAAPDNPVVFCGQANVKNAQGQFAEAAALFMQCYNKSQAGGAREDALYSAFLMYQKSNNFDEGLRTAKLYEANYPQGKHTYEMVFNLADLYTQNKKYDEAIGLLKTLASSPSYRYQYQALFQVAYNLQLSGKPDDAVKIYEIILNANSDPQLTLMALKNMALIYSQKSDDDKTAEVLNRIFLEYPSNNFPEENYLWLIEHWRQKKDYQRMDQIKAALKNRKPTEDRSSNGQNG